jgi:hypothetical protein
MRSLPNIALRRGGGDVKLLANPLSAITPMLAQVEIDGTTLYSFSLLCGPDPFFLYNQLKVSARQIYIDLIFG